MCAYCGHFTVFDSTCPGGAREATSDELKEIENHPDIDRARFFVAAFALWRLESQ